MRESTPEITSNIYPTLSYDDAPAAIEWLCRVLGFTARLIVPGPDGTVRHSELTLGPGCIMVSSSRPEEGRLSPRALAGVHQGLCLRVDDPDAHHAHARAEGATITRELQDEDYGSRGYMLKDPEGNGWYIGTYRPGPHWSS